MVRAAFLAGATGRWKNRETRKYTRAIFGDGQPPGGQRRLKNDPAARCLDTSRSDQPRAVRNEGRARPDRRRATSPRPGRSDQSRPHPNRQVGRMVGVVSGRTTSDFRRGLTPYRDRPRVPPRNRPTSLPRQEVKGLAKVATVVETSGDCGEELEADRDMV